MYEICWPGESKRESARGVTLGLKIGADDPPQTGVKIIGIENEDPKGFSVN